MIFLLGLGALGLLWFVHQQHATSLGPPAPTEPNQPQPSPFAEVVVQQPAPATPQPDAQPQLLLVLRLDITVSGVEQLFGGVDADWIRARIDPTVASIVPEARSAVGWPQTGAARSGVQEIESGFRVVVAWSLPRGVVPSPAELNTWRDWIEARLRRSENGERIHGVLLYTRPAS